MESTKAYNYMYLMFVCVVFSDGYDITNIEVCYANYNNAIYINMY